MASGNFAGLEETGELMDTFSANFLAGFAAEVAGNVVNQMGPILKGKFGPNPQRLALERSIHMGTLALLRPPNGLDSAVLDQLQLGLERFFRHDEAWAALVDLIRGSSHNLFRLDALFQEQVFGAEELLALDAKGCLQRFEIGFWKQAQLEPELAGVLIIGQAQEQTGLQRQMVALLTTIYEVLGNDYRRVGTLGLKAEGPRAETITATNVAGTQIFIHPDALQGNGSTAQAGWRHDYLRDLRTNASSSRWMSWVAMQVRGRARPWIRSMSAWTPPRR